LFTATALAEIIGVHVVGIIPNTVLIVGLLLAGCALYVLTVNKDTVALHVVWAGLGYFLLRGGAAAILSAMAQFP